MWEHVFSSNREWGLSTIKQDHIRQQVGATKSSYTNVSVLKSWMAGMGEGAAANDIGILCKCSRPLCVFFLFLLLKQKRAQTAVQSRTST